MTRSLIYGLYIYLQLTRFSDALPVLSNNTVASTNTTVNDSKKLTTEATSAWWFPNLDHTSGTVRDYVPFLRTPDYPVYKSVSSGNSAAFRKALYADGPNGDRDNFWLAGQPRVVYLAPGTYVLDSTIYLDTDTVIIGDAANPPTIRAAAGFSGDYLICGGQGGDTASGGELHFSVMIKNIVLDTSSNSAKTDFVALSWRVAQNTALANVKIQMPSNAHTGIWMGQGSAVSVGDVKFYQGSVGMHYAGLQQATLKKMEFHGCTTGIRIDNGFTVNVHAPIFDTVGFPIVLNSGGPWVSVIDAISTNSGTFFTSNVGYPNFMLENISQSAGNSPVVVVGGQTKIKYQTSVGTYVYGNTYGANPIYQTDPQIKSVPRPASLAPGGKYPALTAPQYHYAVAGDVVNLKNPKRNGGFHLYGDGSTDDTSALQGALNFAASQGKIAYLPYGIYRVYKTVTIPVGTRLIGNAWSTISGFGPAFKDESKPTPIVRVGAPGAVGKAVIQDMRFTVGEALPGAIILQVNMAGHQPGDVAIFNSLLTVGGTRDTQLSCSSEANCKAAYLGLHLSTTSSAYIDNFWSWLADHASDSSNVRTRTAGKGGIFVEARKGTWLAGVASEHWWLYQFNFNNAKNIFMSLIQSETNYNQGTNAVVTPPSPFVARPKDPAFAWCHGEANSSDSDCPMGPAQFYDGGDSIFQYAAASWNFFGGEETTMNVIRKSPTNLHLYGLCDHDAKYIMRLPDGSRFGNGPNDGFGGSWGTVVAEYSTAAA
ncbi:glycoside hydrolase family 55 protein [Zasmidium cellare ATCC 36951]|uniref:Glycoside hydrolase family 55 protein n=1 Tax=Zasmidium cellare ATCC 36951 TaxID=1080233 RepID=A0A6A6CJC2_ZASCE|nr:glycoside hydrolase family 55 protein [Zasmidium cellare ATCC 36951]KAF2166703.1 glycoside hydrolase family 55 protein [Zasmidium cellare ATCC 36951]